MKKQGFKNSSADPCLFLCRKSGCKIIVVIVMYVDDGLIAGSNNKDIELFISDEKGI